MGRVGGVVWGEVGCEVCMGKLCMGGEVYTGGREEGREGGRQRGMEGGREYAWSVVFRVRVLAVCVRWQVAITHFYTTMCLCVCRC